MEVARIERRNLETLRVVSRIPPWRVSFLERGSELDVDQLLATKPLHDRRLETVIGEDSTRLVLELGERAKAARRHELLRPGEAVDALLWIDHEDAVGLVDAVDGTDVDA